MITIKSRLHSYFLAASVTLMPLSSQAEILFEESFDDQPDYTSTMFGQEEGRQDATQGDPLPEGWTGAYVVSKWNPEDGYPTKHASHEILARNSGRGGTGKSIRHWRESFTLASGRVPWNSDSQLIKAPIDPDNPEGTNELYVEFWIRFSENWFQRGWPSGRYPGGWTSKIFRAASWTPGGNFESGVGRDLGPMFYWDYRADNYGIRNVTAFRGGPPANIAGTDNYKVATVQNFEGSGNYNARDIAGQGIKGEDPQLRNQVSGGLLADTEELVTHEMLFGPPERWTKIGFYLKMNSAPGVPDGVLSQYINGHRIKHLDNIPWVETNEKNIMVKWNHISIGGNDYFAPYPNDMMFEDWYEIDDIVVRSDLPEDLMSSSPEPSPPENLSIEVKR